MSTPTPRMLSCGAWLTLSLPLLGEGKRLPRWCKFHSKIRGWIVIQISTKMEWFTACEKSHPSNNFTRIHLQDLKLLAKFAHRLSIYCNCKKIRFKIRISAS